MRTANESFWVSFTEPRPDSVAERHGGLIVAFALSLVVYSWLVMTVFERPPVADARRDIRIVFKQPEPPPPPPERELSAAEDTELAATSVNPSEDDPPREALLAEQQAAEADDPQPASLSEWRPRTAADRDAVASIRERVTRYRERLERSETGIKSEINRMSVESAGREFLLNTDGGRSGIIRTFDYEGFPNNIVVPLLNRYGISIDYRHVEPGQSRQFLNAVELEDGTFTNVAREGFYEVLVFSPKAVAMMAAKEARALRERGHSPVNTRIRKVVFGIIMNDEDEYDIDVVEMEVEQIR